MASRVQVLCGRWECYVNGGGVEQFVEFTLAVNSLAEHFNRLRLPGLVRLCQGLESAALTRLEDATRSLLPAQEIAALQRQLDTLVGSVAALCSETPDRRSECHEAPAQTVDWVKRRAVWIVSSEAGGEYCEGLQKQLRFFGFEVCLLGLDNRPQPGGSPLAVLFVPAQPECGDEGLARISAYRAACPAAQLFYIGGAAAIDPVVGLMRAGVDIVIPAEVQAAMVIDRILDLVRTEERVKHKVLVVEDSRVATALIRRTLAEHGFDSRAIADPEPLLDVLKEYRPDLILMDMHMPRFNGVEATRVLRQIPDYQSIPIVYLSGETDVGMQVEALRLGGDQFLVKPFNPVLLAAVVKTKIERFREAQRSSQTDGLTGLLNHSAAKSYLKSMMSAAGDQDRVVVAMIDIDHFKSINDTYGHPVGDQVIRGLAWLLKARLRATDLIGRYGGEEFIVALPDVSLEMARTIIDRIRGDFASLPHSHPGGAFYTTFSAGMSAFPAVSASAVLETADHALLDAKRLGRNRVECASERP
ncbi:MAG TPA: diguanylate cyclase [Azoarcus taiwanensis]|nr:diguanylate cyclase [Azoarcus taiwanensis]